MRCTVFSGELDVNLSGLSGTQVSNFQRSGWHLQRLHVAQGYLAATWWMGFSLGETSHSLEKLRFFVWLRPRPQKHAGLKIRVNFSRLREFLGSVLFLLPEKFGGEHI